MKNGQYGRDGLSMGSISSISESRFEKAALEWFKSLDYKVLHGPDLAPDGDTPERTDQFEYGTTCCQGHYIVVSITYENRIGHNFEKTSPSNSFSFASLMI